ncbi:hypothetical protein ITP53_15690 [Nonomuraea sp. K274]|uniref:Uncharacterized protein n=1 Tax=Nonomuraea cypriaca TaxID=1187855 RepID=A0A931ABN5_9ACTN|nr:hypothetical protein [Nonomuraea cypriaca]MBF8187154.1 hypothetical protein [Nonomuraea cypriaca]
MNLTAKSFVLAPLLALVYGVVNLLDGLDGSHGPGVAWTAGHLAFLAALALFVPLVLELARGAGNRRAAVAVAVFSLAGIAAAVVQFAIDLVIGLVAADRTEMGALFDQVQQVPGVELAVYVAGPMLFYAGLVALVGMRSGWWRAALIAAGVGAVVVSRDLLPLSALLNLAVLAPLGRPRAARFRPNQYEMRRSEPIDH